MTRHVPTAIVVAGLLGMLARLAPAATWVVDDDDLDCPNASYSAIQSAVNAAAKGDTIIICPGRYTEQIVVSKGLFLLGQRSGSRSVIIQPTTLAESRPSLLRGGNPVTAAILVDTD